MENEITPQFYSTFTYELKEGTKAQYYYKSGEKGILPERISIGQSFRPSSPSSNHPARIGELKATYKKAEEGKYRGLNPENTIHTGIFPSPVRLFYGYGILDERHRIYDLLLILELEPPLKSIRIYFLPEMGRPEKFHYAINQMEDLIKKESPTDEALGK